MRLPEEEIGRVDDFKYLESAVQSNDECGKEVKNWIQDKLGQVEESARGVVR